MGQRTGEAGVTGPLRRAIVGEIRRKAMNTTELLELKQGARATWAAGDYGASGAAELWPVGARIVERVAVRPGESVLDIACGTGNAAIRAAEAGARVLGVDLVPELLERGERLAAEAGVEVEWVEGDAEDLPVADESFDVVLSTFGCMFAPRHEVAARELARAVRRGGRIGITSWAMDGNMGRFFQAVGDHLPPEPELAQPPLLWGDEEHLRGLFEDTGIELEFERASVEPQLHFDSGEEKVEFFTTTWGPLIKAREFSESEGRWPALRGLLVEFFEQEEPAEYLVTLGRKA